METLGSDRGEIDLVQHRAEERLLPGDLPRDLFEHGNHPVPGVALDDDDRVVVLTELADVVDPELVVFTLGIDEIGAAHLVAEVVGRPDPAGDGGEHRQGEHGERVPQADASPGHEHPAEQARPVAGSGNAGVAGVVARVVLVGHRGLSWRGPQADGRRTGAGS
ncbi:MAG: hypothetical protein EBX39_12540 [Actinobacteria bacterium]|nr:hypothetical protein [Actinomycetota bacterium]